MQSYCIHQLSPNYDEGQFAAYGTTILKWEGNKDVAKFDSKLPITALNMLPRAAEQVLHPGLSRPDSYIDIIRGRYISLLATVILSLLIYHWSALLYGKNAGLCSFTLFLLCPNFLAHGIFLSSDIFACLFMTAALFFLWKFNKTGHLQDFIWASCCVGFAEISKFSMIHLLVIFPVLLAICFYLKRNKPQAAAFRFSRLLYCLLVFAAINWFFICAAHLFYGMFIPLGHYQFKSQAFLHLQHGLGQAGNYLYLPFPSSYIRSMDAVIYFDRLGGGMPGSLNGASYILGKNQVHGFWYYYFVVLWYKLPLPVLLITAFTLFLYGKSPNRKHFLQQEMYLLVPILYFLVYLDFFYSTQLGIRHIMIILPLLYVFAGCFFQQALLSAARYGIGILAVWQLASVGFYFPHFLPYTNEWILNKKMAYRKIADSNLCYGEGEKYLQQYLQQHPQAIYHPSHSMPGQIVMEVNDILDINFGTSGKYSWVRPLVPVDHIHSQYLVFDIKPGAAGSLKPVHF